MVMADDENSDFVANATEKKVIKGTAANSQGDRTLLEKVSLVQKELEPR
jgi:hypothetical protein